MFPFGESVVRLRAKRKVDPYTNEARPDWSQSPESLTIDDCAFNPGGSHESVEPGREPILSKPTVYAPYGADILAGDRLVVRGVTFDVDGHPSQWRNPFTGWQAGVSVTLISKDG